MTESTKKILIYVAVGVAVIGIVFVLLKLIKGNKPPPAGELQGKPEEAPTLDQTKVLKIGSNGREVAELQKVINSYRSWLLGRDAEYIFRSGFPKSLKTDENFGAMTEAALFFFSGKKQITLGEARELVKYIGVNPMSIRFYP